MAEKKKKQHKFLPVGGVAGAIAPGARPALEGSPGYPVWEANLGGVGGMAGAQGAYGIQERTAPTTEEARGRGPVDWLAHAFGRGMDYVRGNESLTAIEREEEAKRAFKAAHGIDYDEWKKQQTKAGRSATDIATALLKTWFKWRLRQGGNIGTGQPLTESDVLAIGGIVSPISQVRNLERVYRALEKMGTMARRTPVEEVSKGLGLEKGAGDMDRYVLEFLLGPHYTGRVLAPQSVPENLAMTVGRPGGPPPAIIMDTPSQIMNALRYLFGQRTPTEFVRKKAIR